MIEVKIGCKVFDLRTSGQLICRTETNPSNQSSGTNVLQTQLQLILLRSRKGKMLDVCTRNTEPRNNNLETSLEKTQLKLKYKLRYFV